MGVDKFFVESSDLTAIFVNQQKIKIFVKKIFKLKIIKIKLIL